MSAAFDLEAPSRTGTWRVLLAVLVVALTALAWRDRFVQDDAFIAFRYAGQLVHGHGLVFNPGERVEGYTCFLYVLLIAGAMRLGADPVSASYAIGLLAFVGSLLLACRLVTRLSGSRGMGLLATLVLGANYSFRAYATGGLETQLQAALVLAAWNLAVASGAAAATPMRLAAFSCLSALATLTRPDSALLLVVPAAVLAFRIARAGDRVALRLGALVAPALVLLGGWLAWKLAYYGDLLPNTFHAKQGSAVSIARGAYYLVRFVASYWLGTVLAIALIRPRDVFAGRDGWGTAIGVTVALWILYVIKVGGDFMEFRLFVAVMPFLAWIVASTAGLLQRGLRLGPAVVAVAIVGSAFHGVSYHRTSSLDGIESVGRLQDHLVAEDQNWIGIGRVLGRDLARDSTLTIATTAAGAIPYYSGLRTVDMLGLTDAWVARHGDRLGARPGHQRSATLDYLMERRVNLVLGHPRMIWWKTEGLIHPDEVAIPRWREGERAGRTFPAGMRAVEIPIERGYRLLALYLTPDPRIDRAIRERGWKVRPFEERKPGESPAG